MKNENVKIAFIAQARMTSSRLPGKVAKDICGKPVLYRMIERMKLTRHENIDIIIATTNNPEDDIIEKMAIDYGVKVYRGSENHVLSRYYYAAKENNVDIIVRVTCDELLLDPRWLFDDLLEEFLESGTYDYYSVSKYDNETNSWIENEPSCGCNVEIFTFAGLERCMKETNNPYCIEHVTPFFYMNPDLFRCGGHGSNYVGPNILPYKFGTSLDTENDLIFLRNLYNELYTKNQGFTINDVIECCIKHPEWQQIVLDIERTPVTYHGEGDKNTGWIWH